MSYLHCPTCRCAYNIATQPRCPRCSVQPADDPPADAAEAIVAALDQLARAMTSASPEEIERVHARLAQRSLPAPAAPEPTLAIVHDPRPPIEYRLVDVTRRLRSWTKARVQRARELIAQSRRAA